MTDFVISGAEVFDGERPLGVVDVHVRDEVVVAVGGDVPARAERVDGAGATLLPGLIDAHVHADEESLRTALRFGVTTELDLISMPQTMVPLRRLVAESRDLADVRSSSVGLTPPDGHPHELRRGTGDPEWPTATRVDEVEKFVDDRIAEGADYLKVLLEDGSVLRQSVPVLAPELLVRLVEVGHDRGKLVLAHALTLDTARQAVDAGVDALSHVFVDVPHTTDIVSRIADAGIFVIPTFAALASLTGQPAGTALAGNPLVRDRFSAEWLDNLDGAWATLPQENMRFALDTVAALRAAGVEIPAGTDAAHLGAPGLAHGASLHDELRWLTLAGWTPAEALRAATVAPAERFGLHDRGRITPGRRADLLLVDGDPTRTISDTLRTRAVWRQGVRLAPDAGRSS